MAIGLLDPKIRTTVNVSLDRGANHDLAFGLRALAGSSVSAVDAATLRKTFSIPDRVSDATRTDLQTAATGARDAKTLREMRDASTALARALTALGPDNISVVARGIKQGVEKDNLGRTAQSLANEAGRIDEQISMDAIGHKILNRMTRNDIALLSDIPRQQYSHPLHNQPVTDKSLLVAQALLDGTSKDPTNGATHFYSPRSQPQEGDTTTGMDVGGGLEQVPGVADKQGQPIKNYAPGWTKTFEPKLVPGVPDSVAKFYKAPGNGPIR